jgi:hypothetical protein
VVDLKVIEGGRPPFLRYYDNHVTCDFCGQQTRGRLYEYSVDVVCGSCGEAIVTVRTPDDVV